MCLYVYTELYSFIIVRLLRICTKSCVIDDIFFKKGTFVVVPVYHLHRDPKIWEDPEEFKPER